MHPLESGILEWALEEYEDLRPFLESQFHAVTVLSREFTGGAGVFVNLSPSSDAAPIPTEALNGQRCIDGPEILAPCLKHGSGSIIWFDEGLLSSIEIYSYVTEYPESGHPTDFSLRRQIKNIINDLPD